MSTPLPIVLVDNFALRAVGTKTIAPYFNAVEWATTQLDDEALRELFDIASGDRRDNRDRARRYLISAFERLVVADVELAKQTLLVAMGHYKVVDGKIFLAD